jgi:hypothetical protein
VDTDTFDFADTRPGITDCCENVFSLSVRTRANQSPPARSSLHPSLVTSRRT